MSDAIARATLGVLFAVLLGGASVAAQAPVINAQVDRRSGAGDLSVIINTLVESGATTWVGYRVPMIHRSSARLEMTEARGRCRLAPPTELVVLARVAATAVVELRPVAVDCDVDADGAPLVWLERVDPERSVAWLVSLVGNAGSGESRQRLGMQALVALGLHDAPSAARALVAIAKDDPAPRMRGDALVWLAQRASAQSSAAMVSAIASDPDVEVKKHAVVALSRLPKDEGIPLLIDVARRHATPDVRRQAMFWLGRSNDPRAVAFFEQVLLR